jgi:hypothetical protein
MPEKLKADRIPLAKRIADDIRLSVKDVDKKVAFEAIQGAVNVILSLQAIDMAIELGDYTKAPGIAKIFGEGMTETLVKNVENALKNGAH